MISFDFVRRDGGGVYTFKFVVLQTGDRSFLQQQQLLSLKLYCYQQQLLMITPHQFRNNKIKRTGMEKERPLPGQHPLPRGVVSTCRCLLAAGCLLLLASKVDARVGRLKSFHLINYAQRHQDKCAPIGLAACTNSSMPVTTTNKHKQPHSQSRRCTGYKQSHCCNNGDIQ